MDILLTIGIQITMNYSVKDNLEMMAPKAHHIHSRQASPSTRPPRGQGEPEDPGPMANLDQPHRAKQDQKGANGPPGPGADNGPPGQPGPNPTAVMTG